MNSQPKEYVIIIGGGLLTLPAYVLARETLGLGIIAFDRDPDSPGMRYADVACLVDTKDWRGAAVKAKELSQTLAVRGVFTCGADVEVAVSAAAEALGLPAVPLEVARRCNDKIAMHEHLDAGGFTAKARYAVARSLDDARNAAKSIGFPLFVKPVDNCASRGVQRIGDFSELESAYSLAASFCISNPLVLIEQSLEGSKHTVEMLAFEGETYLLSIIDTHYISPRWPCETGLNTTKLSPGLCSKSFTFARDVARDVGIDFGAHKVDISIDSEGKITLIELTARLSGGFHCQYASPLAYGSNDILAALKLAVGMGLDRKAIVHRWERGAAVQAVFPEPGTVVSITGEEKVRSMPGVKEVFVMCRPGDIVGPFHNSATRPAFVIADGDSADEAVENAMRGAAALVIETR